MRGSIPILISYRYELQGRSQLFTDVIHCHYSLDTGVMCHYILVHVCHWSLYTCVILVTVFLSTIGHYSMSAIGHCICTCLMFHGHCIYVCHWLMSSRLLLADVITSYIGHFSG
jgi:hypothetical protein